MIKFKDIRVGDYLMADNDGDIMQGEVVDLNGDEKQVCVDTGTQEFWFETNQLRPIPLNEDQLARFKFRKEEHADGSVKYLKGAFRILVPSRGDFSKMDIWYRDELRHIMQPISVHQLQNHFYEMTKVPLNEENFN